MRRKKENYFKNQNQIKNRKINERKNYKKKINKKEIEQKICRLGCNFCPKRARSISVSQ